MQKSRKTNLTLLVMAAIFSAMSIILGKLLAFNIGDLFRVSLENLPIIFMGIAFGPLWGAVVGAVADLLGCFAVGYAVNPIITLGAMSVGAVAGICSKFTKDRRGWGDILFSVTAAHTVGSILIKTAGLSWFYGTNYLSLLPYRALNYLVIIAVEYTIIYILIRNQEISGRIKKLGGGKES
jgi:ECF transporter S component (folate family)